MQASTWCLQAEERIFCHGQGHVHVLSSLWELAGRAGISR